MSVFERLPEPTTVEDQATREYLTELIRVLRFGGDDTNVALQAQEAAAVTDFLGLTDTPVDYTGFSGDVISVNVGEDGLEFTTPVAAPVASVFGRTGVVVAAEGDYIIDELGDVDTTTVTPITDDVLTFDGTDWVPLALPVGGITLATTQDTSTGGTAYDFTGIPAGTKSITVCFSNVSLTGSDDMYIQVGNGAIVTAGYESVGRRNTTNFNTTTGLLVALGNAAQSVRGAMTLTLMEGQTGDKWVATFVAYADNSAFLNGAGQIDLGGELDRIRLTRSGTNTFDNGEINISYQ